MELIECFKKYLLFNELFIGTIFGIILMTIQYEDYIHIITNVLFYALFYFAISFGFENLRELSKKEK